MQRTETVMTEYRLARFVLNGRWLHGGGTGELLLPLAIEDQQRDISPADAVVLIHATDVDDCSASRERELCERERLKNL